MLGRNVRIFNCDLVNLFGCEIGDDSFIGPFVEITRGVVVGKHCVIESHSFLCDSVKLEDRVFVGHGAMFTNDLYPRTGRHVVYRKTLVRRFASIGSNATIVGGVTIGAHAIIGAGAVVTKDVPDFSVAAGNPARVLRRFSTAGELAEYIGARQPAAKD
jgi:acetyltransferase-like isoleucine patch superfamily enzyme